MLILGHSNQAVAMVVRVGAFGAGAFWLGHYGPGPVSQLLGSQATIPYQDHAVFNVPVAPLTAWGWGFQSFSMRVSAFAPHTQPMPIALEVSQTGQLLQALDLQNQSINGVAPPFGSIPLDTLTNGETRDFPFTIRFA